MSLKSIVCLSIMGFYSLNGNAQNASDELLKINNIPFTVGEFERIYNKNLDLIKDDNQKQIDNYLDLFVLYKLKVAKAYELELDKKSSYINEFESHKKQLAEQYLTNQETLDRLSKEAYERSKEEINASHIIFLADDFSTPADTLKAYNKAIEVRNLILNGMDFAEAAVEFSDDPSTKTNKGELGYFSVLRMVYPFETAAYNTAVGEVSMPIRSQYGYHLIKVNDRRLRRGKREIAQIFIKKDEFSMIDSKKLLIDQIYSQLETGANFEELAVQYTDDSTSKTTGGKIKNYEPGTLGVKNFDNNVYQLETIGSYSKPFESQFGWHIVKLISEEKMPNYEETKGTYIRKVQSDERSRIITNQLIEELKLKYNYKLLNKNYENLVKYIEKNISKPDYLAKLQSDKELAKFANQVVLEKDFKKFIDTKGVNFAIIDPIVNGINHVFNDFINQKILAYYNNNLENEFPEFKYTLQEFKEGLLLFDLMETEVWKKVKNDSIGYTNFYQSNLNSFRKEESVEATIYSSEKKSNIKKALKFYKKYFGKRSEDIEEIFDVNLLSSKKGKFKKDDKNLPEKYILKEGISEIIEQDGKYYFVVVDKYIPEGYADLEEIKDNVIYEYQQVFEDQWVNGMKQNAIIEINEAVLKQLKNKYKQN